MGRLWEDWWKRSSNQDTSYERKKSNFIKTKINKVNDQRVWGLRSVASEGPERSRKTILQIQQVNRAWGIGTLSSSVTTDHWAARPLASAYPQSILRPRLQPSGLRGKCTTQECAAMFLGSREKLEL